MLACGKAGSFEETGDFPCAHPLSELPASSTTPNIAAYTRGSCDKWQLVRAVAMVTLAKLLSSLRMFDSNATLLILVHHTSLHHLIIYAQPVNVAVHHMNAGL